ncbi:hypothetical protein [Sigmofec virus UA08Rod_4301]|uniref:Uncharacterized protein n=1 Tax=Sigmofec virus UA08Rod_4301 TaxID=2929398 RepID=A0A976N1L9_9VIRU|nr:hypothetical protein [Sigmofec virus UA08Rod_4301]
METKQFDFNSILERDYSSDPGYLVSVTVMGSNPTVIYVDDISVLTRMINDNPQFTFMVTQCKRY